MGKTAAVFGATGLVGSELVSQLIGNEEYHKVVVFNCRKQNYESPKIEEFIIDGQGIESINDKVIADDLYCCIGTAMKKGKSFYMRTKGKMEQEVLKYQIPGIYFFRPSILCSVINCVSGSN